MIKDKDSESLREYIESLRKHIKKYPTGKKKRRTKKDPITIEACLIDYKKNIKKEDATIKFTVTARSEDWKKLADYFEPEGFGWDFWNLFIYPALRECKDNKPRGTHSDDSIFAKDIKIEAGTVFAFFSYWVKKPLDEWPDYLKKIIDMAKNESLKGMITTPKGKYSALGLVKYCMEKIYELPRWTNSDGSIRIPLSKWATILEKYGCNPKKEDIFRVFKPLNPFEAFEATDNFYITYIHDNKRPKRITERLIRGKTPAEIAELPYKVPALNRIFSLLKVI